MNRSAKTAPTGARAPCRLRAMRRARWAVFMLYEIECGQCQSAPGRRPCNARCVAPCVYVCARLGAGAVVGASMRAGPSAGRLLVAETAATGPRNAAVCYPRIFEYSQGRRAGKGAAICKIGRSSGARAASAVRPRRWRQRPRLAPCFNRRSIAVADAVEQLMVLCADSSDDRKFYINVSLSGDICFSVSSDCTIDQPRN